MNIKNILFACLVSTLSLSLFSGPKKRQKKLSKKTFVNKTMRIEKDKDLKQIAVQEKALMILQKKLSKQARDLIALNKTIQAETKTTNKTALRNKAKEIVASKVFRNNMPAASVKRFDDLLKEKADKQ